MSHAVLRDNRGDGADASLAGRVAIVTGAGRGIGRAIALRLGQEGAAVVAAGRTLRDLDQTVAGLRDLGALAWPEVLDVTDPDAVQGMVDRAVERLGGIHVLVNNAGVQGPIGPLVESDPASWMRTVETNLFGTFLCCRAVLPCMVRQRDGRIVNLSGGGATGPRPLFSAYAASKAAVVRLTETLAYELRPHGIRVNAIAPGAVNTRMLDEILGAGPAIGETALADARRQLESGGTPPELAAQLVVFLVSNASNGLTGKLVSALYDDWRSWDEAALSRLMGSPWLTLRRIDAHTLTPLADVPGGDLGPES